MVGGFGIGVAPGAKFIACLGCDKGCAQSWLIKCGQFMLCPTKPDGSDPDCSKAPRVVNNSWGGGYGQLRKFFLSMVQTWIKAGIVPVFSIGNEGPKCNTTGSPGNYLEVIGVGACDSNNMTAIFSSRGPAPENPKRIKPDLTGPGVGICSASFKGDTSYMSLQGTSMAAPHISGIIALMLSVNPKRNTTVEEVKSILYSRKALQTTELKTNNGKWTCNENLPKNKPNDPQRHDNYFGRGIAIALKAVKNTQEWFETHPKENED